MNSFDHKLVLRFSLIVLTLVLSGTCVITSVLMPNDPAQKTISSAKINTVQDTTVSPPHRLLVTEQDGRICVYSDDVLILETDIPIASLPEQDRIALSQGIIIDSDVDLQHLLEDFGA